MPYRGLHVTLCTSSLNPFTDETLYTEIADFSFLRADDNFVKLINIQTFTFTKTIWLKYVHNIPMNIIPWVHCQVSSLLGSSRDLIWQWTQQIIMSGEFIDEKINSNKSWSLSHLEMLSLTSFILQGLVTKFLFHRYWFFSQPFIGCKY